MNCAEGLLPTFGIEPMIQRQLFVEDFFKFGVGIVVVVLLIFIVVGRIPPVPRATVVVRTGFRPSPPGATSAERRSIDSPKTSAARMENVGARAIGAFQLLGIEARFGVLVREGNGPTCSEALALEKSSLSNRAASATAAALCGASGCFLPALARL